MCLSATSWFCLHFEKALAASRTCWRKLLHLVNLGKAIRPSYFLQHVLPIFLFSRQNQISNNFVQTQAATQYLNLKKMLCKSGKIMNWIRNYKIKENFWCWLLKLDSFLYLVLWRHSGWYQKEVLDVLYWSKCGNSVPDSIWTIIWVI